MQQLMPVLQEILLTIAAGSGDVTFTDAVGGSTAMGNITITTGALSAAAIKVQGTIDITNTDTSSITGIISDGASSAIVTKAGSGTLTYLQTTPIPVKLILMQVSSVSLIITLLDQQMVQRLLQMALVYRSLMILPQQKTLPFQVLELVLMVQLETLQMTIH